MTTTPRKGDGIREAAAAILEHPPRDDGRRGIPKKGWAPILRECGWPVAEMMAEMPASGGRTHWTAVSAVPLTWLVALAQRLGLPLATACRGTLTVE